MSSICIVQVAGLYPHGASGRSLLPRGQNPGKDDRKGGIAYPVPLLCDSSCSPLVDRRTNRDRGRSWSICIGCAAQPGYEHPEQVGQVRVLRPESESKPKDLVRPAGVAKKYVKTQFVMQPQAPVRPTTTAVPFYAGRRTQVGRMRSSSTQL